MLLSKLTSYRSKDPKTQVGACIVNPSNHILSVGYNGLPIGTSDDIPLIWQSPDKHDYVCHAEMNAILNCRYHEEGCVMYVTRFPCSVCSRYIVNSGKIKKIVYSHCPDKPDIETSKHILSNAGIELIYYQIDDTVVLNLNET